MTDAVVPEPSDAKVKVLPTENGWLVSVVTVVELTDVAMLSLTKLVGMASSRLVGKIVAGTALAVYVTAVGAKQLFARADADFTATTACAIVALTVRARSAPLPPLANRAKLVPPPVSGSTLIVPVVYELNLHIFVHAALAEMAKDVVVATHA